MHYLAAVVRIVSKLLGSGLGGSKSLVSYSHGTSCTLSITLHRFLVPQDREVYYTKWIEMICTYSTQESIIVKVRKDSNGLSTQSGPLSCT